MTGFARTSTLSRCSPRSRWWLDRDGLGDVQPLNAPLHLVHQSENPSELERGRISTLPPQSIGARAVPARSGCKAEWRFGVFGEPPVWRGCCGRGPSALRGQCQDAPLERGHDGMGLRLLGYPASRPTHCPSHPGVLIQACSGIGERGLSGCSSRRPTDGSFCRRDRTCGTRRARSRWFNGLLGSEPVPGPDAPQSTQPQYEENAGGRFGNADEADIEIRWVEGILT